MGTDTLLPNPYFNPLLRDSARPCGIVGMDFPPVTESHLSHFIDRIRVNLYVFWLKIEAMSLSVAEIYLFIYSPDTRVLSVALCQP